MQLPFVSFGYTQQYSKIMFKPLVPTYKAQYGPGPLYLQAMVNCAGATSL